MCRARPSRVDLLQQRSDKVGALDGTSFVDGGRALKQ